MLLRESVKYKWSLTDDAWDELATRKIARMRSETVAKKLRLTLGRCAALRARRCVRWADRIRRRRQAEDDMEEAREQHDSGIVINVTRGLEWHDDEVRRGEEWAQWRC